MLMSMGMKAEVSEVMRFHEDAIVTEAVLPDMPKIATEAVVLPETEVVIANEVNDSVQAVADSEVVEPVLEATEVAK